MNVLTSAQIAVADRVLDEEELRRAHLVVYLSGAHAYGFPSPDSDLDLKAIHVEPTSALVGLRPPPLHADRMEVIDGVEVDYSSNEIGQALASILKGNGNYLERVLGTLRLREAPELAPLAPLVRATLSKRIHHHYRGFAWSQRRALDEAEQKTAKKILYVLRTALTGTHALLTGEIVADVTQLLDEHGSGEARALIERKRAGERTALSTDEAARWNGVIERALSGLDAARERSALPDEPRGVAELDAWLRELRRARF